VSDVIPVTVSPLDLLRLQAQTPAESRKTRPDRATWQHKDACPGRGCQAQRDPNAHVQLTYVDARYVQNVLDETVGPANWQTKFTMEGAKVSCLIGIRVDFGDGSEWVFKGDGAGATDIEGDKGSFSDAFKRAGVAWGIARDLYGDDLTPAQVQQQAQAVAYANEAGAANTQGQTAVTPAAPVPTAPQAAPQQPAAAVNNVGNCPVHGTPWRTTKGNGQPAKKAYCSGKMANGDYCDQSGPWLQPKS
jgi:hypothetical protein